MRIFTSFADRFRISVKISLSVSLSVSTQSHIARVHQACGREAEVASSCTTKPSVSDKSLMENDGERMDPELTDCRSSSIVN